MATNAVYKVYSGSEWVEYHFTTNAGQVSTTTGRKFVTTSITVNSNAAGTSGARVTLGSGDAANIEIDAGHISGALSGGTYNYFDGTETVALALAKLDTAAYNASQSVPASYLKSVSVSGSTLTLTKQDNTTVAFSDTNTTYTIATGEHDGKIKVTPSSGSAYEVGVYGLGSAAYKNATNEVRPLSNDLVTSGAVATALAEMAVPMVFRGTVGSSGSGATVTSLDTASDQNEGDTYKVVSNGTFGGKTVKNGDTLICAKTGTDTYEWTVIPSGDEPSGTVTSVALSLPSNEFSISGSPVSSSGTLTGAWKSQTANYVFAAPNGSAGTPSFRALVKADLPSLTLDDISDGSTRKLANYLPLSAGSSYPLTGNLYLTDGNYTGYIGIYGLTQGLLFSNEAHSYRIKKGNNDFKEIATQEETYQNLASVYSSSSTYAVGDYCIQNKGLYRCTTAITSSESFNSNHWTAVKVGAELKARPVITVSSGSTAPSGAKTGDIWINT